MSDVVLCGKLRPLCLKPIEHERLHPFQIRPFSVDVDVVKHMAEEMPVGQIQNHVPREFLGEILHPFGIAAQQRDVQCQRFLGAALVKILIPHASTRRTEAMEQGGFLFLFGALEETHFFVMAPVILEVASGLVDRFIRGHEDQQVFVGVAVFAQPFRKMLRKQLARVIQEDVGQVLGK